MTWARIPGTRYLACVVITASMETVKAVPAWEPFSCSMRSNPRRSHDSEGSDRQISPLPCFAIKLMASGVTFSAAITRSPSFSRCSSSTKTIIRPASRSSRISEIELNMVLMIQQKTILTCPPRHHQRRRHVQFLTRADGIWVLVCIPTANRVIFC